MVPGDKEGLGSLFPSLLYSHLRENLTVVKKEEKGKYREIDNCINLSKEKRRKKGQMNLKSRVNNFIEIKSMRYIKSTMEKTRTMDLRNMFQSKCLALFSPAKPRSA